MALSDCMMKVDESGLELVQHGTRAFPAACYEDNLSAREVPWHWHDELEVFVLDTGCARVMAGAETFLVKPGEAVFTNAGVLHADFPEGTCPCQGHSMVFRAELVGGSYDSVFWQDYLRPLTENKAFPGIHLKPGCPWQAQAITAIENAWQACVREEAGYPFRVRAELSELLLLVCQNQTVPPEVPDPKPLRDSQRVKEMVSFIAASYADPITLVQIAGSAAISKSECLRCFRNVLHTTPIQYLRNYRLQQAADRLETTGQKVSEIARECGFLEMSYFSKVFRQKYGCSPVEYRANA